MSLIPHSLRLRLKYLLWPGIQIATREKAKVRHLFLSTKDYNSDIHTLDVGCGNGYFTIEAARRGTFALGITLHEDERSKCEEMKVFLGMNNVEFLTCSLQNLNSGKFDQVLMLDVLEHIKDDRAALRKAHDLLSDDGYIFISVPNRDFEVSRFHHAMRYETGWHMRHGYTFERLERLLDETGFEPIDRRRYGTVGTSWTLRMDRKLSGKPAWISFLLFPLFGILSKVFREPRTHTIMVIARKVTIQ